MADRTTRLRPSAGRIDDRFVARMAGRRDWQLTLILLVPTLAAIVIAGLLGARWHEIVAWALATVGLIGLLVGSAALTSIRGRNLVAEARSVEDLHAISWREFEELVAHHFRDLGWTAAQTQREADGGADIILTRKGERALVQCKRWRLDVDVDQVRAFYGVMTAEKIHKGYFVTTSDFTDEAERFAKSVGIETVRGTRLLRSLDRHRAV